MTERELVEKVSEAIETADREWDGTDDWTTHLAVAAIAAMGGVPRDDQNEDVDSLASARGFTDEQVDHLASVAFEWDRRNGHHKGGPWTWHMIPPEGQENYRNLVRAVLAAVEPGPPRAASSSAVVSSGAAPKGEQEEGWAATITICPDCGEPREGASCICYSQKKPVPMRVVASLPPDRLTPRQIERLHEIVVALGPLTKDSDVALRDRLARLADRGPE